jgi:hypothetical protein
MNMDLINISYVIEYEWDLMRIYDIMNNKSDKMC